MDTYVTSDLHLGHRNIFKFCPRRKELGEDIEAHDAEIVRRWNKQVQPTDRVFLLGDVSFHTDLDTNLELLQSLNGTILLAPGNHDTLLLKEPRLRTRFSILPDLSYQRIGKTRMVVSHYPILEWQNSFHGSYMLHGHSHANHPESFWRRLDIGIDNHPQMAPWSLEEIHAKLGSKPKQDGRLFQGIQ